MTPAAHGEVAGYAVSRLNGSRGPSRQLARYRTPSTCVESSLRRAWNTTRHRHRLSPERTASYSLKTIIGHLFLLIKQIEKKLTSDGLGETTMLYLYKLHSYSRYITHQYILNDLPDSPSKQQDNTIRRRCIKRDHNLYDSEIECQRQIGY